MTESVCVYCCRRPVDPAWRPFCSERCKLVDLQNWVGEHYRVPGEIGSSLPSQGDASDDGDAEDTDRAPETNQDHAGKQE